MSLSSLSSGSFWKADRGKWNVPPVLFRTNLPRFLIDRVSAPAKFHPFNRFSNSSTTDSCTENFAMSSTPPKIPEGLYLVIPVYNEGPAIADVIAEVKGVYPSAQLVCVDDGSKDNTAAVLATQSVHFLSHPINLGQGASLQTGITYALRQGARYIVTYDADGQHHPSDIPALLAPLVAGECDIALGSRFLPGAGGPVAIPQGRRRLLRAGALFTRVTTGLNLTDTHNGYRAMTANAASKITIRQNRMAHASEVLHEVARLKLRYREIPVTIRYTAYSLAKGQRASNMINILWELFMKRS
ncbi:glycosyltransferase family 2 protein [soil metagenome]